MLQKKAFTLVELIVVVTILAILATIGFVSYSGYLTGVRDTNRIASLTSISDGLELYRTKNDLPNPDDGINIQIEGTTIANQGYVGVNVLQTIEYSKAGKDPKDDSYYSYYLTDDKKHYQLMAFLEETENLESYSIVGKTNAAVNYSNRYPKVYGKKLGILTDSNNTPVQEITTSSLNFTGGTTTDYIARFTDSDNITGSGDILKGISKNASCMRLRQFGERKSGLYTINPAGTSTGSIEVYCDMVTSGGGWTRTHLMAYNAITQNNDYMKLFSENKNLSGSGYTTNIDPIYFNEYAYLVGTNQNSIELLETGNIRTVGNKNEGLSEWIRAYKTGLATPFTRVERYYFTSLKKKNKETITVKEHEALPLSVSGFWYMSNERLLSGDNTGGTGSGWGATNMPFGKRGLSGNWCYGGKNYCWKDNGQQWASLWIR